MQAVPQLRMIGIEDVRREIEINPSLLHVPAHRGLTVLIIAAGSSEADVVEFLLDHGAPVDQRGQLGCTALLQACFTGRADVAALLLRRGADATLATNNGVSPLGLASARGFHSIARLLLGHKRVEVDRVDGMGWTPLWAASRLGHADVVQVLLSAGADPRRRHMKVKPLVIATRKRHASCARLLRMWERCYWLSKARRLAEIPRNGPIIADPLALYPYAQPRAHTLPRQWYTRAAWRREMEGGCEPPPFVRARAEEKKAMPVVQCKKKTTVALKIANLVAKKKSKGNSSGGEVRAAVLRHALSGLNDNLYTDLMTLLEG